MTVCCIGPVCIPLISVVPFLLLFIKRMYDMCLVKLGIREAPAALKEDQELLLESKKDCCAADDKKEECEGSSSTLRRRNKRDKAPVPASVQVVESEEQWNDILESNPEKTIVVDFTATWCKPCQKIAPYFKSLAAQYEEGKCIFLKVDVDDLDDVAASCNVTAMPTFQVYQNKKRVEEVQGAVEGSLKSMVQRHCKN